MERTPRKIFRCGSKDQLIAKFPKPPKENDKWRKQVRFIENFNRACDNSGGGNEQNIYAFMALMSGKGECPIGNFGDSS